MKPVLYFLSAALLAGGCASSTPDQSAAAGASTESCTPQATACRAGTLFRCEGGGWNSTFRGC
jgi:hypothetical protein